MNTPVASGLPDANRSRDGRQPRARLAQGQRAILAILVLLTVAAWGLTVFQARTMEMAPGMASPGSATDGAAEAMAGMAETGWSLGGLVAFVVAWAVMMAAMMFPAVTPLLLLYRTVAGGRQSAGAAFAATWVLATGYLLVWAAVGVATYAIVRAGSDLAGRLGVGAQDRWASVALGTTLVVAGHYQFTPLKRACLRQCQSPFGFVMGHWRDGRWGALRMGIIHGAYCLGCCWALFAVLVAAGVMSLAWMLLLTLVIFAEKVFPCGPRTAVAVGLALVALGVLVGSGALGMPWTA